MMGPLFAARPRRLDGGGATQIVALPRLLHPTPQRHSQSWGGHGLSTPYTSRWHSSARSGSAVTVIALNEPFKLNSTCHSRVENS